MNKITGSLKNISPGTLARLALLIAALLNNALTVFGVNPLSIDGRAGEILATASTVFVSLVAYWKNNSFTSAAQKADEFMRYLKEEDTHLH